MLEKMIKNETAKKAAALDRWMAKHDSAHPFPSDVTLTPDIDYIGDGAGCQHDGYLPAVRSGRESYRCSLISTAAVFCSEEKKPTGFLRLICAAAGSLFSARNIRSCPTPIFSGYSTRLPTA